jgi:hypothetical protein
VRGDADGGVAALPAVELGGPDRCSDGATSHERARALPSNCRGADAEGSQDVRDSMSRRRLRPERSRISAVPPPHRSPARLARASRAAAAYGAGVSLRFGSLTATERYPGTRTSSRRRQPAQKPVRPLRNDSSALSGKTHFASRSPAMTAGGASTGSFGRLTRAPRNDTCGASPSASTGSRRALWVAALRWQVRRGRGRRAPQPPQGGATRRRAPLGLPCLRSVLAGSAGVSDAGGGLVVARNTGGLHLRGLARRGGGEAPGPALPRGLVAGPRTPPGRHSAEVDAPASIADS